MPWALTYVTLVRSSTPPLRSAMSIARPSPWRWRGARPFACVRACVRACGGGGGAAGGHIRGGTAHIARGRGGVEEGRREAGPSGVGIELTPTTHVLQSEGGKHRSVRG